MPVALLEIAPAFGDAMTTAVPATPAAAVVEALAVHHGLRAQVSRLASERDELFRVEAGTKGRFVLRLSNPADDATVIEMQTQGLQRIAMRDPALPVPALVPALDGRLQLSLRVGDAPPRATRLSRWLDGVPLPMAPRSTAQRRAIGASLARLALAMKGVSHPGAGLDRFERVVKPRLLELRSQVVHGDFNPHNVLVDAADPSRVSGILDFGDMVETQLANDVAVAACYHTEDLAHAVELIAGYHAVSPLSAQEVELLPDLMVTRLCAAVAITEWRARRYPDNAAYILKNTGIAWDGLQRLDGPGRSNLAALLHAACPTERTS
jgi:hydroxylysine kinase